MKKNTVVVRVNHSLTFNDLVLALAEGGEEQAQVIRLALANYEALKHNWEGTDEKEWKWRS